VDSKGSYRKGTEVSDGVRRTFGELLTWHMARGTRPQGRADAPGRPWSAKALAADCKVSDRSVRAWRQDAAAPADIATLDRVLFGNNGSYGLWREELISAWSQAQRRRRIARLDSDNRATAGQAEHPWEGISQDTLDFFLVERESDYRHLNEINGEFSLYMASPQHKEYIARSYLNVRGGTVTEHRTIGICSTGLNYGFSV
jgi:hypothetical protein